MAYKHISSQFDSEINEISSKLLQIAGLVEQQLQDVIFAFPSFDVSLATKVLEVEKQINTLEVSIDHDIISCIGRRQPTARDLRFLMGIARTTQNLERAGDEIARTARRIHALAERPLDIPNLPLSEIKWTGKLVSDMLKDVFNAFVRLDVKLALTIIKGDDAIDQEYNGYLRKLMTYMMEDPKMITTCLDLIFMAKSIERVGDHAKNIAEQIVYIVMGEDIRHVPNLQIDQLIK